MHLVHVEVTWEHVRGYLSVTSRTLTAFVLKEPHKTPGCVLFEFSYIPTFETYRYISSGRKSLRVVICSTTVSHAKYSFKMSKDRVFLELNWLFRNKSTERDKHTERISKQNSNEYSIEKPYFISLQFLQQHKCGGTLTTKKEFLIHFLSAIFLLRERLLRICCITPSTCRSYRTLLLRDSCERPHGAARPHRGSTTMYHIECASAPERAIVSAQLVEKLFSNYCWTTSPC